MEICIVNCFDTWEDRADLLRKVLEEEGHRATVLMSDFRHVKKVRRTEAKEGYRFFSAEPYRRNLSPERLHSHLRLAGDVFGWLDRHLEAADLLWVFAPPNCFIREAARWREAHPDRKLVIDMIDLWPESMPVGALSRSPLLSPWKRLRSGWIGEADLVVTECGLYRKLLKRELMGTESRTLYLAREDAGYGPDLHLPADEVALLYLGSINHIIDLDRIAAVIGQIRQDYRVALHIVGEGERREELQQKAKAAGARVVWHGSIYDREKKQKIIDGCHFGLNLFRPSVRVGLTMKSMDYFEFGLPLINSIPGDTWEAVRRFRCGVNVEGENLPPLPFGPEARDSARRFFERELTETVFRRRVAEILEAVGH